MPKGSSRSSFVTNYSTAHWSILPFHILVNKYQSIHSGPFEPPSQQWIIRKSTEVLMKSSSTFGTKRSTLATTQSDLALESVWFNTVSLHYGTRLSGIRQCGPYCARALLLWFDSSTYSQLSRLVSEVTVQFRCHQLDLNYDFPLRQSSLIKLYLILNLHEFMYFVRIFTSVSYWHSILDCS